MALYFFEGNAPQIAESAYVHESAILWGWGKMIYVELCHRYKEGLKKL
jgi:hypothetical protein